MTSSKSKPYLICAADLALFRQVRLGLESVFQVRYVPATLEALAESLPHAEAYYASLAVKIDNRILDQSKNLKAITTPSTGLDHIDLDYARLRGITVLSLKEDRELLDKITSTAELAWALILAASRRLPAAYSAAQKGFWGRDAYRGHQIAYKTLGIIGCGRLGTILSQYGLAFRMQVLGCDIKPEISPDGVEMVDFQDLLRRSDIISIHIH
jgi:D-3-phosphoglycerate dehydrogenase / 2-oxoglutarate reductase